MGYHFHIPLGAVEIGENEGPLILVQGAAIAASLLALGGQHVHQLLLPHGTEKLAGLRGKSIIEFLPLIQNVLGAAHGPGIAAAEA